MDLAAIVLTGGAGRRLGGRDKAGLRRDGRRLLDVVLDAAASASASPVVVVGSPVATLTPVRWAREDPPGSGPAAALAAGLETLDRIDSDDSPVLVLAVDLPAAEQLVLVLLRAYADARTGPGSGGVVGVDPQGRRQWLAGIYDRDALRASARAHEEVAGLALRRLLADLDLIEVPLTAEVAADVDTPADLERWGLE